MLKSAEFRRIYESGTRFTSPYFSAHVLAETGQQGPKIGFTVSRAAGGSVVRNRLRRRLREAVRLHLGRLAPRWRVVVNPRRAVLRAGFSDLEREVERLFRRCEN